MLAFFVNIFKFMLDLLLHKNRVERCEEGVGWNPKLFRFFVKKLIIAFFMTLPQVRYSLPINSWTLFQPKNWRVLFFSHQRLIAAFTSYTFHVHRFLKAVFSSQNRSLSFCSVYPQIGFIKLKPEGQCVFINNFVDCVSWDYFNPRIFGLAFHGNNFIFSLFVYNFEQKLSIVTFIHNVYLFDCLLVQVCLTLRTCEYVDHKHANCRMQIGKNLKLIFFVFTK